jgi:hypothetical protein
MTHNRFRRLLALCLLTCIASFSALAQDYKALLGKWDMTSETDGDSVKWTLLLKEADGKLSASLVAGENEMPAKEFSFTDGVLKFKVPYEGDYYDIELKATPEKLTGTWSGGGNSGRTTGIKI